MQVLESGIGELIQAPDLDGFRDRSIKSCNGSLTDWFVSSVVPYPNVTL